jgi:HEAT repeat protein
VGQLAALTSDHDAAVRMSAVTALGQIGPAAASARAAVANCMADSIEAIRRSAARAIKQIDGIKPGPDD